MPITTTITQSIPMETLAPLSITDQFITLRGVSDKIRRAFIPIVKPYLRWRVYTQYRKNQLVIEAAAPTLEFPPIQIVKNFYVK